MPHKGISVACQFMETLLLTVPCIALVLSSLEALVPSRILNMEYLVPYTAMSFSTMPYIRDIRRLSV